MIPSRVLDDSSAHPIINSPSIPDPSPSPSPSVKHSIPGQPHVWSYNLAAVERLGGADLPPAVPTVLPGGRRLVVGSRVRVLAEAARVEALSEGHGG